MVFVPLFFGALLALAHYYSERIKDQHPSHQQGLMSFAIGVSLSYIFLELFPELALSGGVYSQTAFLFVLLGFSVFYLIEKHTLKHRTPKKRKELKEIHSTALFLYHFLIGMVLFSITNENVINGGLLFIPILLHTVISSASLKEVHHQIRKNTQTKIVLSLSTIMGMGFISIFPVSKLFYTSLLGVVIGTLLFIVIKDEMPQGNKGKPEFFLLGIISYTLLIIGVNAV